ncbi:MAG: hypothetical protein ABIO70_16910 [Pseudomonadota bacterium]
MTEDPDRLSSGSYGCFLHPSKGFGRRTLADPCPECGRPYGFPLTEMPASVRDFTLERPLGRGFYGAIYLATSGRFSRRSVLKVIPKRVYEFHVKDFQRECNLHHEVAQGSDHLVAITDAFDSIVTFGDAEIDCHVAVLDYVEGLELDRFLVDPANANARTLAQIAIDLLRLLIDLEQKGSYHNDLHHRNLIVERLPPSRHRPEAIDETVRLVGIDMGSIADRSRSGPPRQALGDLTATASFLAEFAQRLLRNPDDTQDADYRLASTLVEIASLMSGDAAGLRTPDHADFITQIRQAYLEASSPWRPPSGLRRLNDAYNAQTLHPCFVPRLLVDPGGEWLAAVSAGGPQVITGVRGCGKTMLLRALQFHARLSGHADTVETRGGDLAEFVRQDGYVGLYLSARRLLDALGARNGRLHEPYARLLIGYAREAVRAARHLSEKLPASLAPRWWENIATAVEEVVAGCDVIGLVASLTPQVLERRLQGILFSLERGEGHHALKANPAIALPALAEAVLQCSPCWNGSMVLFLLDDVSTRHLEEGSIAELLGTLLFGDHRCAFKLTTEGQTLELALKSPGLVEKARADRDYEPFDLAARVNERLKERGAGKAFLSSILELRAAQFGRHPEACPADLLGDRSLEDIARHIVATGKSAAERKKTYWGLSALAAVCVGDIGDVLNIYDSMLRKHRGGANQILPEVQNEAFQEYSSRRLYHINRRNGELKDFAMSFAEAAYELLLRSARPKNGAASKGGETRKRLRQYTQVYVRITTGDAQKQFDRLRELIDAGVFVLEQGADSPRTKTRDSDPISQFILTYRKLFGLSQHIGLAFSDRFELSGEDLLQWLFDPANGKQVLMANLGGPLTPNEAEPVPDLLPPPPPPPSAPPAQLSLLRPVAAASPATGEGKAAERAWSTLHRRAPRASAIQSPKELQALGVKAVVLGLGFEARTLTSAERLLAACGPVEKAVLVEYDQPGHGPEITALAHGVAKEVEVVRYRDIARLKGLDLPAGPVAVDVTGLAKPVLFHAVRGALSRDGRVVVAHTRAEQHYPLDEDIARVFGSDRTTEVFAILEEAGKIWSGEQTPYSFLPLLVSDLDDARPSLLCAAASAKHERLLSLLDERHVDAVDIVVPDSDSYRAKLARLAADVAVRGVEASHVSRIDSDDLPRMLSFFAERFAGYYLDAGFGLEFGLTGSKMHAVACAAASTSFKIGQVWYVSPAGFDPDRFTHGVTDSHWFIVER